MGYSFEEIKKTPTEDLTAILDSIRLYFSDNHKQKRKNSKFKFLYYRIKREIFNRKHDEKKKLKKKKHKKKKKSSNFSLEIPDFFNDIPYFNPVTFPNWKKLGSESDSNNNEELLTNDNTLSNLYSNLQNNMQITSFSNFTVDTINFGQLLNYYSNEYELNEENINLALKAQEQ